MARWYKFSKTAGKANHFSPSYRKILTSPLYSIYLSQCLTCIKSSPRRLPLHSDRLFVVKIYKHFKPLRNRGGFLKIYFRTCFTLTSSSPRRSSTHERILCDDSRVNKRKTAHTRAVFFFIRYSEQDSR